MSDIIFKLDGREVAAQPGETILQAAARAGVEIPTLCYNQKISKTTSCFVCVVKDLKTGKFLPSCSACPAPGQEIDASSDEVKDMRRTALSTLRYFKNEYLAHVQDHVCEALACPALVDVAIDPAKCIKCKLCVKTCPVGAIDPANNFSVDNSKCTKCNSCIEVCPKKAVSRVRKQSVQA